MGKKLGQEFNLHLAKKVLKKTLSEVEELDVRISDDRTILLVSPKTNEAAPTGDAGVVCRVKNDASAREWHVLVADLRCGEESNARLKSFEMLAENADKIKAHIVEEFKARADAHSKGHEKEVPIMSTAKASITGTILGRVGKNFDIDSKTSPGGGVMRIKPHVTVDGQKIRFPYFVVITIADGAQVMRVDYFRSHLLGSEAVLPATTAGTINGHHIDYATAASAADSIVTFFKSKVPDALEEVAKSYHKFLNPEPVEEKGQVDE